MIKDWKKKLQEIYEGWKNDAFKTPEIENMAKQRANICANCDHNKSNICVKCGCPLSKKTRSPKSTCPINKW